MLALVGNVRARVLCVSASPVRIHSYRLPLDYLLEVVTAAIGSWNSQCPNNCTALE